MNVLHTLNTEGVFCVGGERGEVFSGVERKKERDRKKKKNIFDLPQEITILSVCQQNKNHCQKPFPKKCYSFLTTQKDY